MNNSEGKIATQAKASSIGKAALRRQEQLEKLKSDAARRQELFRIERDKLAKELAELQAHARQAQRKQEKKEMHRAYYLLGEIALDIANRQGLGNLTITRSDLTRLSPSDMELVQTVLARRASDALVRDLQNSTIPADIEIDLPL